MALLRDELEVAMNDLVIALREAVDAYDVAARILESDYRSSVLLEVRDFFTEARGEHQALVDAFEREERKLGYLPKERDSDRAFLQEVATQVKARLVENELAALLEERQLDEGRVNDCSRKLLDLDPPEAVRDLATRAMEQAAAHSHRLTRISEPHAGGC